MIKTFAKAVSRKGTVGNEVVGAAIELPAVELRKCTRRAHAYTHTWYEYSVDKYAAYENLAGQCTSDEYPKSPGRFKMSM